MRTLAVAALLLCSCGSAQMPDLAFTLRGPYEPEFHQALTDWNACGEIHLIERPNGIPVIFDGVSIPGHPDAAGITHLNDGYPISIEFSSFGDVTSTIEHEIGHVLLGKEHYGKNLMRNTLLFDERVSAEDCVRLRSILP